MVFLNVDDQNRQQEYKRLELQHRADFEKLFEVSSSIRDENQNIKFPFEQLEEYKIKRKIRSAKVKAKLLTIVSKGILEEKKLEEIRAHIDEKTDAESRIEEFTNQKKVVNNLKKSFAYTIKIVRRFDFNPTFDDVDDKFANHIEFARFSWVLEKLQELK
jgi:hypothetical protein